MKKYILMLVAACQGLAMMAQSPIYKMKLTQKDGSKICALTEDIESMEFFKVGKVQVEISERYKTSTSLGVNLDIEINASQLKAVLVPASQTISDPKTYIEENATVDSKVSYKKAFDFLTPETEYTVYAMAYDMDGKPSEVTQKTFKTGKVEDDPFKVEAKNIRTTKLDYVVTPKDPNVKYFTICENLQKYLQDCDEADGAGDVVKHFIAMWKAFGGMCGITWQEMLKQDLKQGVYDTEADNNTTQSLFWDNDCAIITFGINENGELTTPIQIDPVRTKAPEKSDMTIKLTLVTNEWRNVVIKAEVSDEDHPYYITAQPESLLNGRTDDEVALWIFNNGDMSDYTRTGSQEWTFRSRYGGEVYHVYAWPTDGGAPAGDPVKIEFTLPEGRF